MNLKRMTLKPEYYFRPQQIIKRLKLSDAAKSTELLWGHKDFEINPKETIGKSILSFGLYDLALSEAIFSIVKNDSLCLDVGANIGYFTSLMSHFAKQVFAFEPHPLIYARLEKNCQNLTNTKLFQKALGDQFGEATLYVPKNFVKNEGVSSLEPMDDADQMKISITTLDHLFPNEKIQIMKMDVEGHELGVINGAEKMLEEGRIENIVFEDFHGIDSPVIKKLSEMKFKIYRLTKGYLNLKVLPLERTGEIPLWEPPNYLATKSDLSWNNNTFWSVLKL